jgi:glycine cleavage system H protein
MSIVILACTGLDKPEGSVAREVAIQLAEEAGADIVCPVVLNRTPARYTKTLSEARLVVVDGCATQCASRLAAAADKKPFHKVIVSDVLKKSGRALAPGLRLDADGVGLARQLVEEIKTTCTEGVVEAEKLQTRGVAPAADTLADAGFPAPSDFLVVVHDKYEFRIPADGFFFNENDVWVQVSGTKARVGISDYMQQRLTDISFVDPPKVGAVVEQFGEVGSVESTKATFELVSPVSGVVTRVNEAVEDEPESINEDPYGSWIAELELTSWEEDREFLVDGPAYAAEVQRKAAEE